MPRTYPVPSNSQEEVNDAILAATAAADRDIAAALKAWQGNRGVNQLKSALVTLPADMKEMAKQADPNTYNELFKRLGLNQ